MPVKISGLKELDKALRELPIRVAKKHLSGSVSKAARLVANDAKKRVPISEAAFDFAPLDSGKLKRNIISFKMYRRSTIFDVSYGVSVRSAGVFKGTSGWRSGDNRDNPRNAYYWTFIEFGTRYQRAQPFLRPAFETNKRRAVGVMARELGRRIQSEARKL